MIPYNTDPHISAFEGYRMDWLVTIKSFNLGALFSRATLNGESNRKEISLLLAIKAGKRLNLGKNNLIFVSCSEFGRSGLGHLHILFSFDGMRNSPSKQQKLLHCEQFFLNAVIQAFSIDLRLKLPKGSEIHLVPVSPGIENSKRVLSYVMKLERGKKDKEVMMPKWFKARRAEKKWNWKDAGTACCEDLCSEGEFSNGIKAILKLDDGIEVRTCPENWRNGLSSHKSECVVSFDPNKDLIIPTFKMEEGAVKVFCEYSSAIQGSIEFFQRAP